MDTSCVKQSDSPGTLHTNREESDHRNADITDYYETPNKYVVDVPVLGGAVSKTYIRLPESRNHCHAITAHYRGLKLPPRRQLEFFAQRFDNYIYNK